MENRYQKFLKNTLQVGLQELYDNPFIKEAAGIPRPTFEILTRAFRSGLPQDLLVNLPEHNLNNKEYLEALIKRIDFLLSPGRIGEPEKTTLSNMPPLANLLPAYERARKSKEDLEKQKVNWRQEFDRQVDKYNREFVARLTAQLTEKFPELKDKPQTEVIVKDLVDKVTASFPEISQPYEGTITVLSQKIEETLKTEFGLDETFSKLKEDPRVGEFSQRVAGQESGAVWNLKERQLLSERGPAYRPVGEQIEVVINAYFPDLASNEVLVGELKRRVLSRLSLPALSALSPEEFKSEYRNEISAILKSPEFRTITKEYQDRLVSALIEETGETAQFYSGLPQATMAGGEIPTISPARGIPPTGEEEPTTFSGRFGMAWVASHPTDFLFFGLSKPSLKTIPSSVLGLAMDFIGVVPPAQTAMMMGYLGYDEEKLTGNISGYTRLAQKSEPGSKEQAAYQSMADFLSGIQSFKQKAPTMLRPFISLGGAYGKFQLFNIRLAHYTGISPFQLLELTAKYGGPGFSYGVETALKIIASRLLGAGLHASLPGLFPYDDLGMEVYFKYGPKGLAKSARGFIFKKTGAIRQRLAGKFLKTAVGKTLKTLVEKLGLSALLGTLTGGTSFLVQGAWYLFKKFWKWIVGALGIFLLWLITQLGTIAGILTFLGGMVLGGIIGSFFGPWGTVVGVIVGPVIAGGLVTLIKGAFFPTGAVVGAPGLGVGGVGLVPSLTSYAAPVLTIAGTTVISTTVFATMIISSAFNPFRYVERYPPGVIEPSCVNFSEMLHKTAQDVCVPGAILMAISQMEAGGVWGLNCEEISRFSSPNWWENATPQELKKGYCYDTCADTGLCSGTTVMGPMQFEEKTWQGIMPGYSLMDRCRLDLSLIAAAKKIKANSGTGSGTCGPWDEKTVRYSAFRYCGSCGTEGCKTNPEPDSCSSACGIDYCGNVWLLYQQYENQ